MPSVWSTTHTCIVMHPIRERERGDRERERQEEREREARRERRAGFTCTIVTRLPTALRWRRKHSCARGRPPSALDAALERRRLHCRASIEAGWWPCRAKGERSPESRQSSEQGEVNRGKTAIFRAPPRPGARRPGASRRRGRRLWPLLTITFLLNGTNHNQT